MFLEPSYRDWFFCKIYENSGESLGGLARQLGYVGKGRNGPMRNMWIGKIGIPDHKIDDFCKLAGISKSDMLKHAISKENSKQSDDWVKTFQIYQKHKNPKPEIFTAFYSS